MSDWNRRFSILGQYPCRIRNDGWRRHDIAGSRSFHKARWNERIIEQGRTYASRIDAGQFCSFQNASTNIIGYVRRIGVFRTPVKIIDNLSQHRLEAKQGDVNLVLHYHYNSWSFSDIGRSSNPHIATLIRRNTTYTREKNTRSKETIDGVNIIECLSHVQILIDADVMEKLIQLERNMKWSQSIDDELLWNHVWTCCQERGETNRRDQAFSPTDISRHRMASDGIVDHWLIALAYLDEEHRYHHRWRTGDDWRIPAVFDWERCRTCSDVWSLWGRRRVLSLWCPIHLLRNVDERFERCSWHALSTAVIYCSRTLALVVEEEFSVRSLYSHNRRVSFLLRIGIADARVGKGSIDFRADVFHCPKEHWSRLETVLPHISLSTANTRNWAGSRAIGQPGWITCNAISSEYDDREETSVDDQWLQRTKIDVRIINIHLIREGVVLLSGPSVRKIVTGEHPS